jgi:peptide/nickel transport system permease protein
MLKRTDTGALPIPIAMSRTSIRVGQSVLSGLGRFARRKPLGGVGGLILFATVLVALMSPSIAPFDPYEVHVRYKYASPGSAMEETGQRFWFGTDQLGRDTLSRIMHGARISVYVSFLSVAIGVSLGSLIGIASAFFGGSVDLLAQRIIDAVMAFPALILALAIVAVTGASERSVIVAIVVVLVPASARVVRAQALAVKEMDYTLAARAVGAGAGRIIFWHMLPNCAAPAIVFATANLGYAVILEAALSFLGVGMPPDVPSWGGILSVAGQKYVEVSPWLVAFPSLAVSFAVFGFNLLGDAVRDVIDPRLRGEGARGA